MPQTRFFRIVLAGLFCLVLFADPAFAEYIDDDPKNCPFPSYSGCKRYVSNAPGYRTLEKKDGRVQAGGGSPTDNFIYGDVSGNELFISYGSIIHDFDGNITDVYGGAAPQRSNADRNSVYLLAGCEAKNVYGGYSAQGSVANNKSEVNNSTAHGDVVGGWTASNSIGKSASSNIVRLSNGTMVKGNAIGGLATGNGPSASVNRVLVYDKAVVQGNVYGGKTKNGNAHGNLVDLFGAGAKVDQNVYGGFVDSGSGSARDNTVTIRDGGSVVGDVQGGHSKHGESGGNTATVDGGSVGGNVSGGYSEFGGTRSNTATVSDGSVGGNVYGGLSGDLGAGVGNAAHITGGHVTGSVYGARAPGGARNNHAEISSAAGVIGGDLVGGESGGTRSNVTGNRAVVRAGTVVGGGAYGGVVGGITYDGNASGNSAEVSDGTVQTAVIGGLAIAGGKAAGNSALVSGGVIDGKTIAGVDVAVIGARGGTTSEVSGNAATLSGGSFSGDIIGGLSESASYAKRVRKNSVNLMSGLDASALANNRVLGSLYTGNTASGTGTTNMLYVGNTLNVRSFAGQVKEVNNFQNFNFQLSDSMEPGSTVLAVTGATPTALTPATGFGFSFAPGGVRQYQEGDEFTLVNKTDNGSGGLGKTFSNVAKGISTLYDVAVYEEAGTLRARIGGRVDNKQAETLTGPIVGGLTLVNLGADLVAGNALDQAWKTTKNCEEGGRWSFFSSFTYEDMEIDDRLDIIGRALLAGMAWRDGNNCDYGFLGGVFFETGYADYDGNHGYAAGRAKFDGNVHYYGGGLLSRYRFENRLRLEASLRGGKMFSDYSAQKYAGDQHPSYDLNTWYYGAHLGAGWDMDVAEALNLDFSAKYFWVRQEGKTVGVMDERVKFDDADSHRVKAGTRLTYTPHRRFEVFAGAAYEHELDGDIDAHNRTSGKAISTLDMDGASGVFEFGVSVMPSETRNVIVDVMLIGSTGTREGFGGHMSLGWNF